MHRWPRYSNGKVPSSILIKVVDKKAAHTLLHTQQLWVYMWPHLLLCCPVWECVCVSESMCFISCWLLFEQSHDESQDKHRGMSTEDLSQQTLSQLYQETPVKEAKPWNTESNRLSLLSTHSGDNQVQLHRRHHKKKKQKKTSQDSDRVSDTWGECELCVCAWERERKQAHKEMLPGCFYFFIFIGVKSVEHEGVKQVGDK